MSKAKERRVRPFEFKALDETGQFTGLAAVYNVPDDYGDIIEPGAFSRTIQHKGSKFPMLWNHMTTEPIGVNTVEDSELGLVVTGQMNLDVARARETHSLMKQAKAEGLPFGLSIGFDTIQAEWAGEIRHVKEIRLWEISPTMFPAQRLAKVADVKSRGATEGRKGAYADFAECVAANQDKDNPEGFCAFLEQQVKGQWPGDPSRWQARIAAMFARNTKGIRLSREEVAKFCASCAEKMAANGLATIIITPSMAKQLPEQLLRGIADGYSEQKAFFADCVDHPPAGVDDPETFCAWLQEQCSGGYPAEVATVLQGVRYVLQTIAVPSVRALSATSYGLDGTAQRLLDDVQGNLQEGLMALMVLLLSAPEQPVEGQPDRRTVREPEFYALAQLMREMQSAMRLRQVGAA